MPRPRPCARSTGRASTRAAVARRPSDSPSAPSRTASSSSCARPARAWTTATPLRVATGRSRPDAYVIDLHCHPLPGIDDGPASTEEALAMLRAAAAGGTRTMVATPHVSGGYPRTRAEGVAAGVLALQAEADAAGIDITLLAGAELELLHRDMLQDDELPGLRLGDGPYTLVELP